MFKKALDYDDIPNLSSYPSNNTLPLFLRRELSRNRPKEGSNKRELPRYPSNTNHLKFGMFLKILFFFMGFRRENIKELT